MRLQFMLNFEGPHGALPAAASLSRHLSSLKTDRYERL
jgi:hypothetical protein